METARASKIAAINDKFRGMAIDVSITQGVLFGVMNVVDLLEAIELYDDFNKDNDPYGEHDFGSLTWDSKKIFWKIDYYDQSLKYGMDPLSPECRRFMTVMLASEY